MRVLFVCTANICRSPSAAAVARRAQIPGLDVDSAGTAAVLGAQGCPAAPLLAGLHEQHLSRPLDAAVVAGADLVLTAARDHQGAVVALQPRARQRTFTLVQAGRLSRWILDTGLLDAALAADVLPPDDPRSGVTAWTPHDPAAWLVSELDAARGMAPAPPAAAPPRRRRRSAALAVPPDDVPDPHELGWQWHDPTAAQITASLQPFLELVRRVQEQAR